jgi:hypothetical protein
MYVSCVVLSLFWSVLLGVGGFGLVWNGSFGLLLVVESRVSMHRFGGNQS